MSQQVSCLVMTVNATADIIAKRGVNFAGAQAVAGEACMGVADTEILTGDNGRVIIGVTAIWEAGAVVDGTENRLMTDADGRVIPWTAGNNVCARLKPGVTATGAGEMIEVFPHTDTVS